LARILIIDDDEELTGLFSAFLEQEGFFVTAAHTGTAGKAILDSQHFSLVILDMMLPDMSGIDILKDIRHDSLVPVLILTAKGDDTDRIHGLETGADDYVSKPCTQRELVARVRAILRRVENKGLINNEVTVGPLRLLIEKREVFWGDAAIHLTSTEFNLIKMLAENAGQVVSKNDLSQAALGRPIVRFDRSIDVHISSIRQKLSAHDGGQSYIKTIRGQGYLFIRE
jgi:DNA-binding response OmpR family regulator